MATKGRGPDTMLVHMAPSEVKGLQALALAHGGSLTINPDTGLPEAGFLSKLLPAIIGFGVTALSGGTIPAWQIGLGVGGFEAVRTGDLGKGIAAGLGAWGGAGLGAGLTSVGAQATTQAATGQAASQLGAGANAKDILLQRNAIGAAAKEAATSEMLKAGAKAAWNDPSNFISAMGGSKNALMAAGAAAAPILADQAVKAGMPTTTTTPGQVRRFTYDPYGQTYSPAGTYPASQAAAQPQQGGIAGLARGGVATFADGGFTDAQVAAYMRDNNLTGGAAFQAANVFGVTEDQLARAQALMQNDPTGSIQAASDAYAASVAGRDDLIAQNQAFYDPTTGTGIGWDRMSELDRTQSVFGVTDAQVERAKQLLATDPYAYKGAQADYEAAVAGRPDLVEGNLAFFDPRTDSGIGQQHLDPRSAGADWNKQFTDEQVLAYMIDAGLISPSEAAKISEPARTGNTQGPGTQGGIRDITNIDTSVTPLPPGVSGSSGAGQIGGGTVVNPNGTITTSPRIPGIPVGGFTGMQNMRDVYTAGGGRLSSGIAQPLTSAQLAAKYQTTGDSKAAYDYLAGKGAYPTRTTAPEIYKPYTEVMGIPQDMSTRKYIFNPDTGTYSLNPAYREPVYVEGERILRPPVADVEAAFAAALGTTEEDKSGDAALQAMLDAGQFSLKEIANRLGISLEDAKKRFKIETEEAESDTAKTGSYDGGSDGDIGVSYDSVTGQNMSDAGYTGGYDEAGLGPNKAKGGIIGLAKGGLARGSFVIPADVLSAAGNGSTKAGLAAINNQLMGRKAGGATLISGKGDGLSDSIPTSIDGVKPARVADGEAYVDPKTVQRLGGGDAKKGAAKLYSMMDKIRKQAHGSTKQQRPVNVAKALA